MSAEAQDEVNAAELQFGRDFSFEPGDDRRTQTQVLSNDDLFYLMEQTRHNPASGELSDTFNQTYTYLCKVATSTNEQVVLKVAETINQNYETLQFVRKEDGKLVSLHPFEKASLANLVKASDTTPEEVLHWVPSLSRFDEEQIQKAIDVVVHAKEEAQGGL